MVCILHWWNAANGMYSALVGWDGKRRGGMGWGGVTRSRVGWDGMGWVWMGWDGMRWDGV